MDFEGLLLEQYRDYEKGFFDYPKSHWPDCEWGRIVMPSDTPVRLISCNSCLIRRNYIRFVHCDPNVEGWPSDGRDCGNCEMENDCETWLRVREAGLDVERILKRLDPDAYHPVTRVETGLVPGREPDSNPLFDSKEDLDRYCDDLLSRFPVECGYLARVGSDQDIYAYYLERQG